MKLITWNTQWCCGIDGRVDPARIVAEAKRLADFDVLCLQEVADHFPHPRLAGSAGEDQFAVLAALLPGYTPIPGVAVDHPGDDGRRRRFGNMILSRLPVRQVFRHLLPFPVDPGRRRHAADRRRGDRGRAVRRAAGDHHAPRVVLAEAAQRPGAGVARDLRRRSRARPPGLGHRRERRPVHHLPAPRRDADLRRLQPRARGSRPRPDAGALRRRHRSALRLLDAHPSGRCAPVDLLHPQQDGSRRARDALRFHLRQRGGEGARAHAAGRPGDPGVRPPAAGAGARLRSARH
ncbi:MAG: endonuclease/exonuclease/phosphatase family protein [Betaproteobacteria bacterium]|nr:endonuclease/exonuclease/phosphatase family protein [Betaproteobacteria bacterium]